MITILIKRYLFYIITLLSPPLTARISPITDQLRCHTTSSKVCIVLWNCINNLLEINQKPIKMRQLDKMKHTLVSHDALSRSLHCQMITLPSWQQLAMVLVVKPVSGAHPTSRTQFVCPFSSASFSHTLFSSLIKLLDYSFTGNYLTYQNSESVPRFLLEFPDFDEVVTTTRCKPFTDYIIIFSTRLKEGEH